MSRSTRRKPAGLDRQSGSSTAQHAVLSETEEAEVAFFFPALQKFRKTTTIAYQHESLIIVDDTDNSSNMMDTGSSPRKRLKKTEPTPISTNTHQSSTSQQSQQVTPHEGSENEPADEFIKMLFEENKNADDMSCDFMFEEALDI